MRSSDLYDAATEPLISPGHFYGSRGDFADVCIALLSHEIHRILLESYDCTRVGSMIACNGDTAIYAFEKEGVRIAFYLSAMGSAIAGHQVIESSWITGADRFIMFGSAGSLDDEKTRGRYVIPDRAFRGEGLSQYYAPAADYIDIRCADEVAAVFDKLGLPYVRGAVWTTDSMYRETEGLARARRSEGCIAVEMEVAGVQAVCDYHGFRLYDFLETGDVLMESDYDVGTLQEANHNPLNLSIALELAVRAAHERGDTWAKSRMRHLSREL